MAVRRFKSVKHPESRPWAAVYGMALMTPIAVCLLPVMILTLVGVLEGVRIVPYVFWAAGGAIAIAAIWTSFQLRREVAEIQVSDEWARVFTISDVGHRRTVSPQRVLDVRDYGSWGYATVGLASFEIERSRWPEYDNLVSELARAGTANV